LEGRVPQNLAEKFANYSCSVFQLVCRLSLVSVALFESDVSSASISLTVK
jgi:hypothetical protein